MRQKRSKTYRKLLSSYILHFGFRPPFQVLIDASFAQTLSALHLTPEETLSRLSDVLQTSQLSKGKVNKQTAYQRHANGAGGIGGGGMGNEEIKLMITQCSMVELYRSEKEGPLQKGAVELAKTWERRKCNHREAIPGDECLEQVVGPTNKHRYIIASDSQTLRRELREKSLGVPVVHANQSRVIVLEKMSDKTRQRIEEIEKAKYGGTAVASSSISSAANIIGGSSSENADPSNSTSAAASSSTGIIRGGNRPKAPNPLSNRKPKKVLEEEKREKERRTREIEERTEANRLKKRKLEEQEQEQQQEQARAPAKQMDGPAKEDVRGEEKRVTARTNSKGSTKMNGQAKEKEEDRGVDEDGPSRKKRRKRGGRGGSSAKESAAAST